MTIAGGWLCETATRGQVSRPLVATRGSASGRALDGEVCLLWAKGRVSGEAQRLTIL